ncbi:MAG TPA: hypothetical protein VEF76_04630 [Patescibacteria group bacterium]|nr:hypothetical protein [Patescibacteria group bacterium]
MNETDQKLVDAAVRGDAGAVRDALNNGADVFALRGRAASLTDPDRHWQVVDIIAEEMKRGRETFLADLATAENAPQFLRTEYVLGETALIRAVKMYCLDQAVAKMKEAGDTATGSDLHLMKDRDGLTLAELLAERGQQHKLLDPALIAAQRQKVLKSAAPKFKLK